MMRSTRGSGWGFAIAGTSIVGAGAPFVLLGVEHYIVGQSVKGFVHIESTGGARTDADW